GGLLAATGGALYVLLTVVSAFFGPRVPDQPGAVPLPALAPEGGRHTPISGTLVLVFVFLAAFVIYYFLNWKWLAARIPARPAAPRRCRPGSAGGGARDGGGARRTDRTRAGRLARAGRRGRAGRRPHAAPAGRLARARGRLARGGGAVRRPGGVRPDAGGLPLLQRPLLPARAGDSRDLRVHGVVRGLRRRAVGLRGLARGVSPREPRLVGRAGPYRRRRGRAGRPGGHRRW